MVKMCVMREVLGSSPEFVNYIYQSKNNFIVSITLYNWTILNLLTNMLYQGRNVDGLKH